MVYKFFDKKIGSEAIATSKARANVNELLPQELHKPVIKKMKRRKVYSKFKMGLLSSKNGGVKY